MLPLSETVTDLKNPFTASGQQTLHIQFRRRLKEMGSRGNGEDVLFRDDQGLADGSIHLKKTLFLEEKTNCLKKGCTKMQPFLIKHGESLFRFVVTNGLAE